MTVPSSGMGTRFWFRGTNSNSFAHPVHSRREISQSTKRGVRNGGYHGEASLKKKAAIYGGIADDARHTENKNMSVMIV